MWVFEDEPLKDFPLLTWQRIGISSTELRGFLNFRWRSTLAASSSKLAFEISAHTAIPRSAAARRAPAAPISAVVNISLILFDSFVWVLSVML